MIYPFIHQKYLEPKWKPFIFLDKFFNTYLLKRENLVLKQPIKYSLESTAIKKYKNMFENLLLLYLKVKSCWCLFIPTFQILTIQFLWQHLVQSRLINCFYWCWHLIVNFSTKLLWFKALTIFFLTVFEKLVDRSSDVRFSDRSYASNNKN